jgi:hypothetical protein
MTLHAFMLTSIADPLTPLDVATFAFMAASAAVIAWWRRRGHHD